MLKEQWTMEHRLRPKPKPAIQSPAEQPALQSDCPRPKVWALRSWTQWKYTECKKEKRQWREAIKRLPRSQLPPCESIFPQQIYRMQKTKKTM